MLGGLLGGLFGGDGERTTTQSVAPPQWALPYIQNVFGEAERLGNRRFFPGQTYADTDPRLSQGLGMRASAALGGSSMVDPSMDLFRRTVGGDFMTPAALSQAAAPAIAAANRGLNASMGQYAGRGDSLTAQAQARAAAEAMAGQRAMERGFQQQAMQMLPGMLQASQMPGMQLGQVGREQMALDQRGINEAMARHQFAQNEPYERLRRRVSLMAPMLPSIGREQTMTEPDDSGGLLGALAPIAGYALGGPMGASIGGSLFGGGGGGGFLGGLFGGGGGLPPMTGL